MPTLNYIDSIGDVSHVILTPRLSHFSVCNIEKLGGAWGRTRLARYLLILYGEISKSVN